MIKQTILVDNYLESPLKTEHGFAMMIEYQNKRILFDTGQHDVIFDNAKILNVSLKNIDYIILSHGHYDHGGNIAKILELNPQATIVAHPNCCIPRYSIHPDKPIKEIGLSKENKAALINHEKIIWSNEAIEIMPNFWVSGEITRLTDFEDTGGPFYLDDQKKKADLIIDDMSIWYIENNSINIVCGCCHSGICNTIEAVKKITPKKNINSVTGGLHLLHSNENRLNKTMKFLKKNVNSINPCHCTGEDKIKLIKQSWS